MKFYPYKREGEQIFLLAVLKGGGRKKFPPFNVRLRWLGVVSSTLVKYSFLFSTDILIMIINH